MSHDQRANSFLFEPLAFLNDFTVLAMDEAEVGAYIVLLLSAWHLPEPGVIPDDDRILSRLSRTAERWPTYRDRVSAAFDLTIRPGFWVQKRMVETYENQTRWVDQKTFTAESGGKARAASAQRNPNGTFQPVSSRAGPAGDQPTSSGVQRGSGSGSGSGSEKQVRGRVKGIAPAARARFAPPTLEELSTHLRERGSPVDPEAFIAHYDSNGWMVGKRPMRNWKAAVITWEKNGLNHGPNGAGKPSRGRKIMEFGAKLKAEEVRREQG